MSTVRVEPVAPGLPVVAIVGRPNVGKSTLFNRLVRERRAIVDDAPGVTRDRLVAPAEHAGRQFLCVDTGGFDAAAPRDPAALTARVRAQALAAVAEADCIVCVFDGAAGFAPSDRETARLLAASGKPVLFAVNKVDVPARDGLLYDFYSAGVERLFPISSAHGRGIDALRDAIVAALPTGSGAATPASAGTRLALVGRPNVGKSSLLNRLLGAERTLVAPEAGTTRDAIDTPVVVDGVPYVLIDTAGIRRRGKLEDTLERHGAVRALGQLARTDLVLLVIDAAEGMTDQDARIASRAWEAGRGIVLVANKWDTLPRERQTPEAFRQRLAHERPAFADLPLLCVSAATGAGLDALFPRVAKVARAYAATLATPQLNRILREAVETNPPPAPGGRPIRLLYAAQTGERPPEVTVFASAPGRVGDAYTRYLTNRLSATFALAGVPLRLRFRARHPARPTGCRAPGTPPPARRSSRRRSAGAHARRR